LLLNRFKALKKDKKGVMAIEIVIGMFMFLMIVSFLTDVALLAWKFNVVAQTNSYLARTVGIQGGLLSSTPDNFPGGDSAYVTYGEMKAKIEENFKKAGIAPGEYSFSVSPSQADYGEFITTEIRAQYKWSLISNFIPGNLTNTISSKRTVMSEFKYRYDDFKGE
jgi:Flp pilus assembly protein TadG